MIFLPGVYSLSPRFHSLPGYETFLFRLLIILNLLCVAVTQMQPGWRQQRNSQRVC